MQLHCPGGRGPAGQLHARRRNAWALSKAAVSQRIAELERATWAQQLVAAQHALGAAQRGRPAPGRAGGAEASFATAQPQPQSEAARGGRHSRAACLRVTAPVALGRQHIAPAAGRVLLRERYPEIRIELDLSDRLAAAGAGRLRSGHPPHQPRRRTRMWPSSSAPRSALLVGSPRLPGARRAAPMHPAELAAHACLPYLRPGPAVWLFEQRGNAGPERLKVPVQGPLRAANSEVLREAALAGLGIALLPDFSAAPAVRAGRLKELLPTGGRWGFSVTRSMRCTPGVPARRGRCGCSSSI